MCLQVMQAVVFILEGDHSIEIKEQALCILANIADGDTAKTFIMSNEDVLKKVTRSDHRQTEDRARAGFSEIRNVSSMNQGLFLPQFPAIANKALSGILSETIF